MIYDIATSWRGLRARPIQTVIPMLVMALALALSICVLALGDAARRGIARAADPFGVLVVGPKGDGQQLVLNSILLQGLPLGTIPYDIYARLAADPRARLVVPLAKGDNLGGAPMIGTNANFFELRTDVNAAPAFQIGRGRLFAADFEAVLGARAAAEAGLDMGDSFRAAHGVARGLASDIHENVFTVVGVLAASGTPYDNAVYTTVESVWSVHEEAESDPFAVGDAGAAQSLTSILVQPVGFSEQNQLWQEFYVGTEAQAVFPGQELGGLFDLLRQGEQILQIVGYLVLGIAALTVFLSMYSAILSRERDIAIMRSLGAGRTNVFRVVLFETLSLTLIGALIGRIMGYGAALIIASAFAEQATLPLPVRYLTELEPLLWLLPLMVGLLAGLLPAIMAYSVDVVEKLSAS
ncbi:MAG: ABC transporter permease [Chloroflexota bacterium]|nr:ABC transporter permease [Chloroflexota bacterium]